MQRKRSRLALTGMLALALSVTVGLLVGPAEAAKKKGKKGGTVSVSRTAPTAIPLANATTGQDGFANVPLTVGNKAKGKVVGADSATIATSWSGGAGFGASPVFAKLIAPNGRAVGLAAPAFDSTATAQGPTTETPNSPFGFCVPSAVPPPPPCADPDNIVGPPYAGTIGNVGLAFLGGVGAKGTWQLRVRNTSTTVPVTLNSVALRLTLKTAPR